MFLEFAVILRLITLDGDTCCHSQFTPPSRVQTLPGGYISPTRLYQCLQLLLVDEPIPIWTFGCLFPRFFRSVPDPDTPDLVTTPFVPHILNDFEYIVWSLPFAVPSYLTVSPRETFDST